MTPRLVWPNAYEKGNPFGGEEGFRSLRITFHSQSLTNLSVEDSKALEILFGLATLSQIDAMSFDGQIYPKILVEPEESQDGYFNIRVIDSQQTIILYQGGVHKSWLDEMSIVQLMNLYGLRNEEKINRARQDFLHAKAHNALHRDIFITTSKHLIENRDNFEDLNVRSPLEALKIVSLYLRSQDEYETVLVMKHGARVHIPRRFFYQYLTRGLLPKSWKYISTFQLHPERESLVQLGWSVLERCIRALQARDEITRIYYREETKNSEEMRSYHFDYLTLLLTAALDVQVMIINIIYGLGLKDDQCGIRRGGFKNALKRKPPLEKIKRLLDSKSQFISILFDLRNKIHSVSLKEDYSIPESYRDELLEKIYSYNPKDHWGIQKEKVTRTVNEGPPTPTFNYVIDIYALSLHLIDEGFQLINSLMEETRTEEIWKNKDLTVIKDSSPKDIEPYIQTCLLLG